MIVVFNSLLKLKTTPHFLSLMYWFLSTLNGSQRLSSENLSQFLSLLMLFLIILLDRKCLLFTLTFIMLYRFALVPLITSMNSNAKNLFLFFEGRTCLSLNMPWTNSGGLNALFVTLNLASILSFCLFILSSLSNL